MASTYLSEKFITIFDDYSTRFKKKQSEKEYMDIIESLCSYAKKDFLDLDTPIIQEYFRTLSPIIAKSTKKNRLRVYLAVARFIDEHALAYNLLPAYTQLFDHIDLGEDQVEYSKEYLPSLQTVDAVLKEAKANGDMTLFIAMALALRCCLPINDIISLKRNMFLQDFNGNYGLRIKINDLSDRFLKLPDDVARLINQYTTGRSSNITNLLLNQHNKPMTVHCLQRKLRTTCQDAAVSSFTFNDLKVLGTAYLIKGNAPMNKIAEYTNLSNTNWFFRYKRVVKELDYTAVDCTHIRIEW